MGRAMTPQELAEFNERRRKSLEETAAKLGVSPEQFEEIEAKARRECVDRHKASKEETEEALRAALLLIERGAAEPAQDSADELDGMSVEEFSRAIAGQMSALDEEERTEAAKVIARQIACWRGGEDEPGTLREEIMLTLNSMVRRHNYYANRK